MTAGELSDAELVRRCRRGEADAWRLLVRRVGPLVYRIAVRVLGRGPEAEDAGQEALLSIYRSLGTYDATRSLDPWVARVAYNASLKHLARRRRPGLPNRDPDALLDPLVDDGLPSPEVLTAHAEAGSLVMAALERLSPEDRVLVTLSYREGLSNSEVAQAMDMPIGTVKTRLYRARGRLRRWLAPVLRRESDR